VNWPRLRFLIGVRGTDKIAALGTAQELETMIRERRRAQYLTGQQRERLAQLERRVRR
jgi:hypothetical protein